MFNDVKRSATIQCFSCSASLLGWLKVMGKVFSEVVEKSPGRQQSNIGCWPEVLDISTPSQAAPSRTSSCHQWVLADYQAYKGGEG